MLTCGQKTREPPYHPTYTVKQLTGIQWTGMDRNQMEWDGTENAMFQNAVDRIDWIEMEFYVI